MPFERLSERKKVILRAIIDDYIRFAEPVGSRSVSKKHELSLSSATIRNEMADLEEMGYLEQPHTSAGRVPSDKGYRYYVDELMELKIPTLEEMESVKNALEVQISELNQLIKVVSNVVSRITKYTSLATASMVNRETIKTIRVVPIELGKALVIGVTNAGIVKNALIKISNAIQPYTLLKISNFLNEQFNGRSVESIDHNAIIKIIEETGLEFYLLAPIVKGVIDCVGQIDNYEIYFDGATNILNYPEFNDIVKAREFLLMLDEKDVLQKLLLSESNVNKAINIKIGEENDVEEVKNCTVVLTSYKIGDSARGTLGVIGPTRMEYSRVISSIHYIRKKIDQEINKLLGNDV